MDVDGLRRRMLQRQMSDWLKVSCHGAAYENEHKKTRRLTFLVLCLIAALGSGAAAQTSGPTVTRQSEANVPARLVLREGVGHAYPGWEADAALFADWFDAHLRRVR